MSEAVVTGFDMESSSSFIYDLCFIYKHPHPTRCL